jgi:transcriptional regulator with PAS, ATPase and Fis domain
MQQRMQQAEEYLKDEIFDILYKSSVGILIVDGDGKIVWGNQHYEKITLLKMADLIGKDVEDLPRLGNTAVMGSETMRSLVKRERKTVHRIVDFKTENDVICTTTPIFDGQGDIRWLVYIQVDWDELTHLRKQLHQAFEESEASRLRLQEAMLGELDQQGIIAKDKTMLDVYAIGLRASRVDATLLILGETGTGKDRMAKFIHKSSRRKEGNFVHVNCSAIPESLFESELFGYEPGAFTGAGRQCKMGLIELANKGTLYLDEIAELPLGMQAKLLTVLQEKKLMRIGGTVPRPVDIRVIAATNRNLIDFVKEKKFREDLYYRLNVLKITIPPLRERKYDIPAFLRHFTEVFNQKYNQNKSFSPEVLNAFMDYSWPGNVRELEHFIERLIIMCPEELISLEHLPKEFCESQMLFNLVNDEASLKTIIERVEEEVIRNTIAKTSTLKEAADRLGIEISTLTKKKQKYNIYKNDSKKFKKE